MASEKGRKNRDYVRGGARIQSVKDISLNYEGHSEVLALRPPDVSRRGMFVNTSRRFPEGAVLNLEFRLELTGAKIETRCEVRYCLAGVGVGVEFLEISPKAEGEIEREIELCKVRPARNGSARSA